MKKFILAVCFVGLTAFAYGQISKDLMLGVALDVLKTDFNAVGDKVQLGVELNYFLVKSFSVTGGYEVWSRDRNSIVVGMRWFPIENGFVRFRGLVGENDLSFGFGWGKPLNRNWRLEAMGDYFTRGDFAVRGGMAYLIK